MATASGDRRNNIDFLRVALAILVLFSHSYLLTGQARREPFARWTQGQIDGGGLAVNAFFVLSGFLIAASWQRSRGVGDFLRRRALRIYPAFLVVGLLCALVIGPLNAANAAAYWNAFAWPRFFYRLAQLQLVLPPIFTYLRYEGVNGSLWTIRYEFLCYLLVAVLGLAGALRVRAVPLLLFVLALAGFGAQTYVRPDLLRHAALPIVGALALWPRFLAYYLAGVVAFLYRDRLALRFSLLVISLLILLVTARTNGLALALPLAGTYPLLYAAFAPVPALQNFGRRGDFSYGIYLIAFPVQQQLLQTFHDRLTPLSLFALALPLTFALAALSWYGVERPCLRWKSGRKPSPE